MATRGKRKAYMLLCLVHPALFGSHAEVHIDPVDKWHRVLDSVMWVLYAHTNTSYDMDPVLKAGLPKLFVLASLQTAAARAVTAARWEGGKIHNILWKEVKIRSAICLKGKKGKYSKCKEGGVYTTEWGNRERMERDVVGGGGREPMQGHVWVHFLTSCFNRGQICD